MTGMIRLAFLTLPLIAGTAASAQTASGGATETTAASASASEAGREPHAIGADLFYSFDADDTEVMRAGIDLDLLYSGPQDRLGIRLEKARFNPLGQGWQDRDRVYLQVARPLGDWKLAARVGTDGDTLLGSASIHNEAKLRQEYFVERDIVETPQGLGRGIYYTFGGAVVDVPVDERNVFTFMAGLQEFTGDNVRTHLRANYVHVVQPEWGLSAQLRTRYYRSSHPREFDYYSPRYYAEALPVLQLRRFSGGWRYLAAAGIGAQRDSDTDWRQSNYFNARVSSPASRQGWAFDASFLHSNTPSVAGSGYSYNQLTMGLRRSF